MVSFWSSVVMMWKTVSTVNFRLRVGERFRSEVRMLVCASMRAEVGSSTPQRRDGIVVELVEVVVLWIGYVGRASVAEARRASGKKSILFEYEMCLCV